MISYEFYVKKVNKIIDLLRKNKIKLATIQYFLFKENLRSNLLSLLFFIKKLKGENKLSKDLRLLMIDYILCPFISDWEGIFQDVKKVINGHIPFLHESKIKEIIKKLRLKEDQEIIFFNYYLDIISDIECYLEDVSDKNIEQIIVEAAKINIKKFSKQELFHFYYKPKKSIDKFLNKNNLNQDKYEEIKMRIKNLRVDQICALAKIIGIDFDRENFERIADLIKNKSSTSLDDIIVEASSLSSLDELIWWLELFEKYRT